MNQAKEWLHEIALIAEAITAEHVDRMASMLISARTRNARVFVLGVGGSAANASHAVNDLRRIGGMEAYAPTDNIAELTALTNDCGWHTVFEQWLIESHFTSNDVLMVMSVNGGTSAVSANLVSAVRYANEKRAMVLAIVGRPDGYAARHASEFVAIPCPTEDRRTPHSESFQAVIWHCLCYALRDAKKVAVSSTPAGVPTV